MLSLFVAITIATPASAATIQLKVDGVNVISDVNPEIKNDRTMVPLRVISENLGATVHWTNSEITLSQNATKVVVKTNSTMAMKNGSAVQLDTKPYVKNNRTFVPLRFIAEAFSSTVNYKNGTVNVDSKPLIIDQIKIKAVQHEFRMTMGGIVQQIYGNAYTNSMFTLFSENIAREVEAPESYSDMYTIDIPGSYYRNGQFDFIDEADKAVKSYEVYALVKGFPEELLEGYPPALVYEESSGKWYLFNDSALDLIYDLVDTANDNGFIKVIRNTVA